VKRPRAAQADGRDRRPAHPLAHHEDVRRHGINDFVICCGYKGYVIKEYFANYFLHMSDVTFDMPATAWSAPQAPRRALARDAGGHRRHTP
jgi:hypothetical protein